MSNIRFSQLSTAVSLTDDDLFAISSADTSTTPTTYTSVKSPISQVAAKIVEDTTFTTSLQTTNKTVAGAINEVKASIPNIPDPPTTDGTYQLVCTVSSGTATYSWVAIT